MDSNNQEKNNYLLNEDDLLLVTGGVKRNVDSGMCSCGRGKAESNGYCRKCNSLKDMK